MIKTGGRNNSGTVTSWHRGGGAKRLYRCIDFVRSGKQGPGVVERLEYDPNRSARIALVRHHEGGIRLFTYICKRSKTNDLALLESVSAYERQAFSS